jgi:mannonate dehydratase
VSNFGIQEYMRHTRETDETYFLTLTISGVDICIRAKRRDWESTMTRSWLRSFHTSRAYLPVNRKLDGTIFNW